MFRERLPSRCHFLHSMTLRNSLIVLLLVSGAWANYAMAQRVPESARLLEAWNRNWLADFGRGVTAYYTEIAHQTIEGPRRTDDIEIESRVTLSSDGRDSRVQRSEFNGRRIGALRLSALQRRMERAYGPAFNWIRQPHVQASRLVASVRPVGRARLVRLNGIEAWEINAVPRQRTDRIENVVFWFEQSGEDRVPRLLRTRIVNRVPNGSAVVTTDYQHISGIDLPARSTAEVVVRQRRRNRLFSILMNTDVQFHDVRVLGR